MLLTGYSLEIVKSKCNSLAKAVHCFAHLDNDISEVLPFLKTNCRQCGEPTCMVFSSRVIEGSMDQNGCPPITPEKKMELQAYLEQFSFE